MENFYILLSVRLCIISISRIKFVYFGINIFVCFTFDLCAKFRNGALSWEEKKRKKVFLLSNKIIKVILELKKSRQSSFLVGNTVICYFNRSAITREEISHKISNYLENKKGLKNSDSLVRKLTFQKNVKNGENEKWTWSVSIRYINIFYLPLVSFPSPSKLWVLVSMSFMSDI